MASEHQLRLSSVERSNLVAYLDGELTELESQQIAAKLTHSVSGRHEVDALKRTWELLDVLPRPAASPDFASRTLSLVAGEALPDDRLASVAGATAQRVLRVVGLVVFAATAAAGTYALVRWAWPDPTARLAVNLSVAEWLDAYQDVERFEYLQQLDALPDFHQTGQAAPTSSPRRVGGEP